MNTSYLKVALASLVAGIIGAIVLLYLLRGDDPLTGSGAQVRSSSGPSEEARLDGPAGPATRGDALRPSGSETRRPLSARPGTSVRDRRVSETTAGSARRQTAAEGGRGAELAPEGRSAAARERAEDLAAELEERRETELREEEIQPKPEDSGEVDLVSGSIRVVLVDAAGAPVEGARVSLRSDRDVFETLSDSRGEAFFGDLAAASYAYLVQVPEGPELASRAPVQLREGEDRTLPLRLGEYDLAISGRVLNRRGEPIPGIRLVAVRRLLSSGGALAAASLELASLTDAFGIYRIVGLETGDYEVRSVATERYPSVRIFTRAGVSAADLVVVESQDVAIYGSVTSVSGEVLGGVTILPIGQVERAGRTQEDGRFELTLAFPWDGSHSYTIQFRLDGYREKRVGISTEALGNETALRLDVQLAPVELTTTLTGMIRAQDGRVVPGETVQLYSASLRARHYATSDADGAFSVSGIELAPDYDVTVRPKAMFQDYAVLGMELLGTAPFLEIILQPLATGRLSGQMVDLDGNPIPGFHIWLSSREAEAKAIEVTGDGAGFFVVEDAPAGRLELKTRTSPHLSVGGILLEPGEERDLLTVLDWGERVVEGEIVDATGAPVAGAQIDLRWSHQTDGTYSTSTRRTTSDDVGFFRFTQFGPGVHVLDVRAEGYARTQATHEPGVDPDRIEVWLEEL